MASLLPISGAQQLVLHDGAAAPREIRVGANAQLTLYRLWNADAAAELDIHLARDARLHLVTLDLGPGPRQDLRVYLEAPGAEVTAHGVFAVSAGTLHNELRLIHAAPHGRSRAYYRGIVGEGGKAVFNGTVEVVKDAQKSDSELRIANLLLSAKAECNTKPELQIYADDVKCAHGATFGQLDEDALFYLRTRGIALADARRLLITAFAAQVLEQVADTALRERASLRLHELLTRMQS